MKEALNYFEDAGALHQKRWVGRGRPGAFAYPFYIKFHRALIERCFPHSRIERTRISVADEPIWYLYNFLYNGCVYYSFSGFKFEQDNKLKPGLVSHYLCIDRHLKSDAVKYDFMAGDNRYKTSLCQSGPNILSIVIQQPRVKLKIENALRRCKKFVEKIRASA